MRLWLGNKAVETQVSLTAAASGAPAAATRAWTVLLLTTWEYNRYQLFGVAGCFGKLRGSGPVCRPLFKMRRLQNPTLSCRAIRHMEKSKSRAIFAAGTGNPYFSTDTTAALRAAEIEADAILMAKKGVDGVYDSDPAVNPDAKKFDELPYIEVIKRHLSVMDSTAISLCMDNNIPIVVFNIDEPGNILRAAAGEKIGTLVGGKE